MPRAPTTNLHITLPNCRKLAGIREKACTMVYCTRTLGNRPAFMNEIFVDVILIIKNNYNNCLMHTYKV